MEGRQADSPAGARGTGCLIAPRGSRGSDTACMRFPMGDSARFRASAPDATERTAVSVDKCCPYMRTAEAISGRDLRRECGDGSLVLRNSIRCETRRTQITALIEGDNGALLLAMRCGITASKWRSTAKESPCLSDRACRCLNRVISTPLNSTSKNRLNLGIPADPA